MAICTPRWFSLVLAGTSGMCLALGASAERQEASPRKIVLIAGQLDANHPKGTHEYEKSVQLLKHCLETSPNLKGVQVEEHYNGWPKDDSTLNDAHTIVLISSGSDRNEKDHPLLVADRLQVLGKQMKRGCGLVTIHWATFFPNDRAKETVLEWVGGYFDYQSGPPPRKWYSAIQHLETTAKPGSPEHPICRGLKPFKVREEFYYNIRFRESDERLKPILLAGIPGEARPQVVAWAVERKDGGRGFGFTGGHYFDNWHLPEFRKLVLNAIAWTAKGEVPKEGVESMPPQVPVVDADWTPRPGPDWALPWEKETDKDWVDGRFRDMDTGPYLNATMRYPFRDQQAYSYRATAIRIGEKGEAGVLFDRNQCRLAAGWTGGYLKHGNTRFGLMNTPAPAGEMVFASASGPGWADPSDRWGKHSPTAPLPREWAKYRGLYLHGQRVVLSYTAGGVEVLDSPWLERAGEVAAIARTLEVGPASQPTRMLICEAGGDLTERMNRGGVILLARKDGNKATAVALVGGNPHADLNASDNGRIEVIIKPHREAMHFKVLAWHGPVQNVVRFAELARTAAPAESLKPWTQPGSARWTPPLVTKGELGEPGKDAPFTVDTLTVPYDNPHKALMFLGGVDFLPNGEIAVCSAHGDVWLVQGVDDRLEKLTWKRFATGLYQPLGLKVVDGKIHVLERGQLTRLHDFNNDGEADFYECLANDWDTGPGEHSYDTCLETDPEGNFYFFKTGDTNLPTGGTLLRVSKDGRNTEVFCTGFRHPIGLGMSPEGILTGADQEGNWMPATRIDQYRQGGFYGDMRGHHRDQPPRIYDGPLCWLPRQMDNSAGGQVWVAKNSWGPLAEQCLHFSYGRCKMMLLLRQEVDGMVQGGAVDLGVKFLSGSMRGRFHPRDGHLYVVGMDGWQTAAQRDGCLQRVRYTGKKLISPIGLAIHQDGIRLAFTEKLDKAKAEDVARYQIEQWNYRWSGDYGSKRWSPASLNLIAGQDRVPVASAELLPDGKSVFLNIAGLKPVMQMEIAYRLTTAAGEPCTGVIYNTIHRMAEGFKH